MKCTNCGTEFNGKFCTNCGTPAQATPEVNVPNVEPIPMATPSTDFPTFENMPLQSDVMPESAPVSQEQPISPYQSTPVNQTSGSYSSQPNNFGQPEAMPQSNNFGSYNQPAQSEYPANPVNNNYSAGPQFTNATPAQGGKKKMSGGKIAAIIISIVVGVLLLLGIVVGIIIWKAYNTVKTGIDEFGSAWEEEFSDYNSDFNFEFNYDDSSEESSDLSTNEEYVYNDDLSEYITNAEEFYDDFGWQYVIDPEDNNKAIIVGLNMYMAEDHITSNNVTITVPETIDGKKVDQIHEIYIYDPGIDNFNVKLVVPGHIKTVHDYAFEYAEDCLTEVVFEEGVESIGREAIFRCEKIKKITVPESVKTIGEFALGFTYNDDFDEVPVSGLTIVTKKNSAADEFAKQNNIKVEYN